MSFFKQVEGEAAILVNNGVFSQVDLYSRDGYLFAKHGSGFVRLYADGSTSKAKLRLDFMSYGGHLCRDSLGRLCDSHHKDAQSLTGEVTQKLLGSASA